MNQEQWGQIIDVLSQVADLLYQGNIQYAYRMLALEIPELERMIISIPKLDDQNRFKAKLMEAVQAMENSDYVMLADILQYEIVESVRELEKE